MTRVVRHEYTAIRHTSIEARPTEVLGMSVPPHVQAHRESVAVVTLEKLKQDSHWLMRLVTGELLVCHKSGALRVYAAVAWDSAAFVFVK